ncbi:MAG: SDR family oxidoreductase, partial [Chloroflexi bacterium]
QHRGTTRERIADPLDVLQAGIRGETVEREVADLVGFVAQAGCARQYAALEGKDELGPFRPPVETGETRDLDLEPDFFPRLSDRGVPRSLAFLDSTAGQIPRVDIAPVAQEDAAWQKAVGITLFSAVRLTRLVLPHMRKAGGGSIVYMTSTTVRQPTQYLNLILSNAIRAAVQGMAKTLSSDLAKDGVRVNCVQPGRIFTERIEQLDSDTAKRQNTTPDAIRAHYEKTVIPMGRYGKPEEFAAAVVFLASPKASYITGTSLQVDGGMLMSMF